LHQRHSVLALEADIADDDIDRISVERLKRIGNGFDGTDADAATRQHLVHEFPRIGVILDDERAKARERSWARFFRRGGYRVHTCGYLSPVRERHPDRQGRAFPFSSVRGRNRATVGLDDVSGDGKTQPQTDRPICAAMGGAAPIRGDAYTAFTSP